MEIALLKEKIGNTKDSDDRRMIVAASLDDNRRNKRPVRLLPPHILFGERKNETEQQKQMNRRRFEQPTNCSDLSLLGFTLNGFYLVKSNDSTTKSNSTTNDIKLETVYCAFKQPEGNFNPALVEKRILSRRETKPSSGRVLCFHATRNTDFKVSNELFILFDNVSVNLGSFNGTTGKFTVPKSGVYLLIFRGLAKFSEEISGRNFNIYYFKNDGRHIGTSLVHDNKKSVIVEADKLVKANRGDVFMVGASCKPEYGAITFAAGNSTSFAGYLLD